MPKEDFSAMVKTLSDSKPTLDIPTLAVTTIEKDKGLIPSNILLTLDDKPLKFVTGFSIDYSVDINAAVVTLKMPIKLEMGEGL